VALVNSTTNTLKN